MGYHGSFEIKVSLLFHNRATSMRLCNEYGYNENIRLEIT